MSTSYKKDNKIKYSLFAAVIGVMLIILRLIEYYTSFENILTQFQTHSFSVILPAVSQALAIVWAVLVISEEKRKKAVLISIVFGALCIALMPAAVFTSVPAVLCIFIARHIKCSDISDKRGMLAIAAVLGYDAVGIVWAAVTRNVTYQYVVNIEKEKLAVAGACAIAIAVLICGAYRLAGKQIKGFIKQNEKLPFYLTFIMTAAVFVSSIIAFNIISDTEYVSCAGYAFALIYLIFQNVKYTERRCDKA